METEGVVRMRSRSQQYGLRWTYFIRESDLLTFNAVCALNIGSGPYDVAVKKD